MGGAPDLSLRPADLAAERTLALRSSFMFALFARVFRRALSKDFHALRIARSGPPPDVAAPRLIVFCNHPSWWDAVAFLLLADTLFKGRPGYAPIEAAMVERYRFMPRIGAFGIETQGRAGASAFLATARLVLSRPDGLLLVTGQGRFADARERPVRLKPGLAHMAKLRPDVTFVPLALECVFWNERKPELLVSFGAPLPAASLPLQTRQRTEALERALEATMDTLARDAIARDPAAFDTLFAGSTGVGGFYDLWRWTRATLTGKQFSAAHGDGR